MCQNSYAVLKIIKWHFLSRLWWRHQEYFIYNHYCHAGRKPYTKNEIFFSYYWDYFNTKCLTYVTDIRHYTRRFSAIREKLSMFVLNLTVEGPGSDYYDIKWQKLYHIKHFVDKLIHLKILNKLGSQYRPISCNSWSIAMQFTYLRCTKSARIDVQGVNIMIPDLYIFRVHISQHGLFACVIYGE